MIEAVGGAVLVELVEEEKDASGLIDSPRLSEFHGNNYPSAPPSYLPHAVPYSLGAR